MHWRVENIGEFYHCGEQMVVYFNPATGDTHLISDFAAYLVKNIADQPMNLEQLIQRISPDITPEDLAELEQAVPAMLADLHTLDIIEPT